MILNPSVDMTGNILFHNGGMTNSSKGRSIASGAREGRTRGV